MNNRIYTVFKRSVTGWENFGSAKKYKIESGLTYEADIEHAIDSLVNSNGRYAGAVLGATA